MRLPFGSLVFLYFFLLKNLLFIFSKRNFVVLFRDEEFSNFLT